MRLNVLTLLFSLPQGVWSANRAPLEEDNTAVLNVGGVDNPDAVWWPDSYSIGNRCFCKTTFDHGIGNVTLETPMGLLNLHDVCSIIGPGPGWEGRPIYNDIQCGNGPQSGFGDETTCPGRVDYGITGCAYIGPKFNFDATQAPSSGPTTKLNSSLTPGPTPKPSAAPSPRPTQTQYAPLLEDNTAVLDVEGEYKPDPVWWPDSYSVGDSCYCKTTFDHDIGNITMDTPLGTLNIYDVCAIIGPGPGYEGRPLYNDIQCGNGPANGYWDETNCPGRVEHGKGGCGYIGPKFNFGIVQLKTSNECTSVQFSSTWETLSWHPYAHQNAMGGMLENGKLIVVSGNWWSLTQQTPLVYALDTASANPWNEQWRPFPSLPVSLGLTNAATAISGSVVYLCGGSDGKQASKDCFSFNGASETWTELPSLPSGRVGGALMYSSEHLALIFSGGEGGKQDTWVLNLEDPSKTWSRKTDMPSTTGHMVATIVKDASGGERYFALRGGNLFEWDIVGEFWTARASAGFAAASNALSANCGLMAITEKEIWFYDPAANTWAKVWDLPRLLPSPICGIREGYLYCVGGTIEDNSVSIRWSLKG